MKGAMFGTSTLSAQEMNTFRPVWSMTSVRLAYSSNNPHDRSPHGFADEFASQTGPDDVIS